MLSTYRKEDTLSDYRQQFTEKYGVYEEVPLLQLFSKALGLGKPEEYKSHYQNGDKYRHKDEGRFRQLKALIAEWQTEALVNHSDIVLDEVKIQQLSELSLENVHVSFDLYYSCMENEQGEVTFYLNNRAGSLEACQSFGRFAYMFDKDSRDEIFNFVRNPKDQKAGESAAEISFYPFSPKITNIMTVYSTPDQSMDMFHVSRESEIRCFPAAGRGGGFGILLSEAQGNRRTGISQTQQHVQYRAGALSDPVSK